MKLIIFFFNTCFKGKILKCVGISNAGESWHKSIFSNHGDLAHGNWYIKLYFAF